MLDQRQCIILAISGAMFWLADVAWIRLAPLFVVDPLWGGVSFLLSVPVAWICVWLCRRVAGLDEVQLVPGITLLVAVAALAHGLALRWAPGCYGGNQAGRLGSAWLLWIYGLILGSAFLGMRARASQGALPLDPSRG